MGQGFEIKKDMKLGKRFMDGDVSGDLITIIDEETKQEYPKQEQNTQSEAPTKVILPEGIEKKYLDLDKVRQNYEERQKEQPKKEEESQEEEKPKDEVEQKTEQKEEKKENEEPKDYTEDHERVRKAEVERAIKEAEQARKEEAEFVANYPMEARQKLYRERLAGYVGEALNKDGEKVLSEHKEKIEKLLNEVDENIVEKTLLDMEKEVLLEYYLRNLDIFTTDKEMVPILEDYIYRILNIQSIDHGPRGKSRLYN